MRRVHFPLCCSSVILLTLATAASAQNFRVPGTAGLNWIDTGLDLPPGTLVQLSATGEVDVGAGWGRFGPEGTTAFANVPGYPAETRYRYGLVARITASRNDAHDDLREEWSYGEQRAYCAARGGHLWLTANDDAPENNTGEFAVTVRLGACERQSTAVTPFVSVYTASRGTPDVPRQRFTVGEIVLVQIENRSPRPIYYLGTNPAGTEIATGESIVVEQYDGNTWRVARAAAFIDEPAYRFREVGRGRSTRQRRAAGPGRFRVALTYYASADSHTYEAPPNRSGGTIVYSEPFEVVR